MKKPLKIIIIILVILCALAVRLSTKIPDVQYIGDFLIFQKYLFCS